MTDAAATGFAQTTAAFRAHHPRCLDFIAYIEMLASESDGEAAATMLGHIDDVLSASVRERFPDRPMTGIGESLSDAILARSWTCFRVGLLTEEEHLDCELLAKAGSLLATGDARHFDDVAGLTGSLALVSRYEDSTPAPPRTRFMTSAASLLLALTDRNRVSKPARRKTA